MPLFGIDSAWEFYYTSSCHDIGLAFPTWNWYQPALFMIRKNLLHFITLDRGSSIKLENHDDFRGKDEDEKF